MTGEHQESFQKNVAILTLNFNIRKKLWSKCCSLVENTVYKLYLDKIFVLAKKKLLIEVSNVQPYYSTRFQEYLST